MFNSTGAVLGLAGANVGNYKQHLEGILPFRNRDVKNDSPISLEDALGDHDGALAVARYLQNLSRTQGGAR